MDFGDYGATPTERIKTLCKPVKLLMSEQKKRFLTRNPENPNGHALLREQYSLPKPNLFKYGRAQGGISNIELEKLGIGTVRPNRVVQPKRVLPRSFRNDPFADPPPISETDIHDGMFSLLNRGIIPRDVDVSPAFDRGSPALTHQRSELALKDVFGPAHLQYKVDPAQIKYLRQMNAQRKAKEVVIDPEKEPDASLHRGKTFLTSLNIDNTYLFRSYRKKSKSKSKSRSPKKDYQAKTPASLNGSSNLGSALEGSPPKDQTHTPVNDY